MTAQRQKDEVMFQASIAPFKMMLREGIITGEEYGKIHTILDDKYHPIFIENMPEIQVDIPRNQS